MFASYAISVRSLGDRFEGVRGDASRLAEEYDCRFWWKPEPDDWHRFVFTKQAVTINFVAYLRKHIVKNDHGRVKILWVSPQEIRLFADHCVHIRSVFEYARRIFAESTKAEQSAMESVAPRFFEDLAQVFAEFVITSACRVTDPWVDSRGQTNLVVGHFTKALGRIEPLHRQLIVLQASMEEHRDRIENARNKLTAHADLETIKGGEPLGTATWPQWYQSWKDLGDFVSLVHEHVLGSPFEIRAAMVRGDAEMVLKKMQS
jgi:hypothetical protein